MGVATIVKAGTDPGDSQQYDEFLLRAQSTVDELASDLTHSV